MTSCHGVKQPRNPWSDGPEYVTQCAIQPGTNFTYKVIFSDEEGTLWWHAHSDWTQSSVHGAIIIMPAQGTTYPFPQPGAEQVIVLDLPRPSSFVINGQPGGIFNCSSETQYRLYVDYGKTYLLRLINAAVSSELFFAIADHNVTVVGMDGNYLKPISTSYLVISPGQTVNVLLTANQPLGYYYMAIRQYVTNGYPDVYPPNTAIVEYRGNYTPPSSRLSLRASFLHKHHSSKCVLGLSKELSQQRTPCISANKHNSPYVYSCFRGRDPLQQESMRNWNADGFAMNNMTFLNTSTDVLLAYYRWEDTVVAEKLAMHIADVTERSVFEEKHNDNLISDGHCVLIFSQTRKMLNLIQIGIDVEEKQRTIRNDILSFARRYFSHHEMDFLAAISDPEVQRQEFIKNISYSADFPDFPLNYYNFTGDNLPNSTAIPTIATKVKMLNYNETVQVVFQESNVLRGAENHPMHMHGYSFYVVGSGPGNYDNVSNPKTFNLVDPPQVNTFRVPKNGWVAIRFQANNPV
ncbi:unnamed protein product [Camellia sinensis]